MSIKQLELKAKTTFQILEESKQINRQVHVCKYAEIESSKNNKVAYDKAKWVLLEDAGREVEGAQINGTRDCDEIREKINDVIGPQLDLLKIDPSKYGAYRIHLTYNQIEVLRSALNSGNETK